MRAQTVTVDAYRVEAVRCPTCGLPVAWLDSEGALVIVARHHGRDHVLRLPFADLVKLRGEVLSRR